MDKNMERRVWQRVYGNPPPRRTPRQRQELRRCLDRAETNLRFYESQRGDPIYAEAFSRLAMETAEHCKMLRQIMQG